MSLRTALAALPDDRGTVHTSHEVIAYLSMHVGEPVPATRISRSTGLELSRVVPVLTALARYLVIDCDGDPSTKSCTFKPDTVLKLEVERYMRSGSSDTARLQSSLGKFRARLGPG